jgi:phosphoglycerate dehydrogenase-like enzyme
MSKFSLPESALLTVGFAHAAYCLAEEFAKRAPLIRHFEVRSAEALEARIKEVDVLVVSANWRNEFLERAPNLRFIQCVGSGTDQFSYDKLRARGIRLANARGLNERAVSEHAMAVILALARHLHFARDLQAKSEWRGMLSDRNEREDELGGKTLVIVGLGRIGTRLAQLARAFDLRVIGVKRHPQQQPDLDAVITPDRLSEVLPQADFVVLTCPLTPETEGMIGAAQLMRMKRSAFLINVARGRVVDEPALIDALRQGRIAGAGLDTFYDEPLPSSSALWGMPQVLITPHTAGETRRYEERVIDILLENMGRLWDGKKELKNQII